MMHGKRLPLLLLALVVAIAGGLVAFGCGTAASLGVPLEYSLNAGDSWSYDMTVVANGRVSGPGMTETGDGTLPKDTTVKMRVSAAVKDVTAGISTVVFKYETLGVSADGKPVDKGSQPSQEITVKIDETGKVVGVEGLDQGGLASGLFDSGLPFDPSEFTNQFSVPFPESGLGKVGDEWSSTASFPIPGIGQAITATTKAKLVAVTTENGREIATIDYSVVVPMDLSLDLGALLRQMSQGLGGTDTGTTAFKMAMAGSVDFTGTAKVDTADGRPVSMDGTATLDIKMSITEAPADLVPQDQRGPFSIDMTISLKMAETE